MNYVILSCWRILQRNTARISYLTRQLSLDVYCLLDFDLNVYPISLQFLSTLFAPLNFVMEKVESILPSSLWHQLTRI